MLTSALSGQKLKDGNMCFPVCAEFIPNIAGILIDCQRSIGI